MAAYIFAIFFVTMASSATLTDVVFSGLHAVPKPKTHMLAMVETFSFNYTFWLNVLAAIAVTCFAYLNRKHPMDMMNQHDDAAMGDHTTHPVEVGAGHVP